MSGFFYKIFYKLVLSISSYIIPWYNILTLYISMYMCIHVCIDLHIHFYQLYSFNSLKNNKYICIYVISSVSWKKLMEIRWVTY
jgi:hypothetical protein